MYPVLYSHCNARWTAARFTNLCLFSLTPTTATAIGAAESRTVLAERRCKSGRRLAFEKTTGYELIRASPKRLFSDRDGGIVGDCASKCEEDARCQGRRGASPPPL